MPVCRKETKCTVDCNSYALAEDVAIGALERWNLAKLVEQQVVRARVRGINFNNVKIEFVGLCNGLDGSAAGVALR